MLTRRTHLPIGWTHFAMSTCLALFHVSHWVFWHFLPSILPIGVVFGISSLAMFICLSFAVVGFRFSCEKIQKKTSKIIYVLLIVYKPCAFFSLNDLKFVMVCVLYGHAVKFHFKVHVLWQHTHPIRTHWVNMGFLCYVPFQRTKSYVEFIPQETSAALYTVHCAPAGRQA